MATLDLNILPIRRINGQELADMPGLLAITPPRKTARGREQTNLILYLALSGNTPLTTTEVMQLTNEAASLFYQSPGSLTFAMRAAVNDINTKLLERNLSTASQGQNVLGWLVMAALRENQCTLLLSGPTHAVWVTDGSARHIYEPALSGKGLGTGQNAKVYLSQVDLRPQDLLVLCATFPRDWGADLLNDRPLASLDASYRKLVFAKGDLNAVLVQAQNGHGLITLLRPDVPTRPLQSMVIPIPLSAEVEKSLVPQKAETPGPPESPKPDTTDEPPITEEQLDALADFAAHMVQPSAYSIPPQPEGSIPLPRPKEEAKPNGARGFPASIPRAKPVEQPDDPVPVDIPLDMESIVTGPVVEEIPPSPRRRKRLFKIKPEVSAKATRQVAKAAVGGIKIGRRANESLRAFLQKFVPRLLPGTDANQLFALPTYAFVIIAVVIPLVVVTMASVVYLQFGQSVQYDELYGQAQNARDRAVSETDPARQRDQWLAVLSYLHQAEDYRKGTDEVNLLRSEAQAKLDGLMGVIRLAFAPAFPNGLGSSTQIGRMSASESDLYMLNAEDGRILHASFTGRSLNLDNAFNCRPGTYSGYQVGALVDILALPKVNALNATVLGIDASGNLLYCAPDQVAQAIPLPALPNTNWGRITSFSLDNGNLYVLDAEARSLWVFRGKDGAFLDTPYFYFGNEIPNTIDSAIDMAVSSDDLYLLHADGHLSTCTFSRIAEVPTRCQDPAPRLDNYPAHRDIDILAAAHFTQMSITASPNSVILLLDSESQSVYRFSPRSFELQNQVSGFTGKDNPFQPGVASAMTVSPNYVLYLAIGDQVYFATNLP